MKDNWIKDAIKKPGALKKALGIKKGKKIPAKKLAKATKAPGKMGQRARLAKTLKSFKKVNNMKISASQRKALEAAGYIISKSGSTVKNKSGGTVGGYNENGNIFSGSKTVRDILKGTAETPKAAPKAKAKAKYKPASEKTIAKGKGISTDELSFEEALGYFQDRGKERGMNSFRYKGKVFDLSGKEIVRKAAPKAKTKVATKTQEKPVAKDAMKGYRSGDVVTTKLADSTKNKTDKMRGKARVDSATRAFKKRVERALDKAEEKKSTTTFVPVAGATLAARRGAAAQGKPYNPNFGKGGPGMAEGFQGKYQTGVARAGAGSGAPGINSGKVARKLGTKGGRRAFKADEFNPFLN